MKNEAAHVRQEGAQANYNYLQLKENIQRNSRYGALQPVNGHRPLNPPLPKYLRDHESKLFNRQGKGSQLMSLDSKYMTPMEGDMRVESARISIDRLEDAYGGNAAKRINDSVKQLKERHKGIDVLSSSLDNTGFYDKLFADLNDIETINARVERDVEFRTQQRVKKFGVDGKRIIGIDIKIPDIEK